MVGLPPTPHTHTDTLLYINSDLLTESAFILLRVTDILTSHQYILITTRKYFVESNTNILETKSNEKIIYVDVCIFLRECMRVNYVYFGMTFNIFTINKLSNLNCIY